MQAKVFSGWLKVHTLIGPLPHLLPLPGSTERSTSVQSRIDAIEILRRISPSYCELWQNMRTESAIPQRNAFLYYQVSLFYTFTLLIKSIQVLIDSTLRYNIVDQLIASTKLEMKHRVRWFERVFKNFQRIIKFDRINWRQSEAKRW